MFCPQLCFAHNYVLVIELRALFFWKFVPKRHKNIIQFVPGRIDGSKSNLGFQKRRKPFWCRRRNPRDHRWRYPKIGSTSYSRLASPSSRNASRTRRFQHLGHFCSWIQFTLCQQASGAGRWAFGLHISFFRGILGIDTRLEDIERIEVIRRPGGILWGANAVNGVIILGSWLVKWSFFDDFGH